MLYKNIFASLLLIIALGISVEFVKNIAQSQRYKMDWVEINHIHYGLLNASTWTDKIAAIMTKKINAFEFTPEKRVKTRALIEKTLAVLFDEAEKKIRQRNLRGKSGWELITGGIKQLLVENLIQIDKLKKDIPLFADKILLEMEKPENKQNLINLIKQQLQKFSTKNFNQIDLTAYKKVITDYQCQQRLKCNQLLEKKIRRIEIETQRQLWSICGCLLSLICLLLAAKKRINPYSMTLILIACLTLLGLGVVTPMIEIEAKITELTFQLFAEPVQFSKQVIYYQNKSIADVIRLLVQTNKAQTMFVGGLIFSFSIVFPLLKLFCSALYYYDLKRLKQSAFVRFFALKSGKWSMADVWVVALFMAYLGFDGLVGSQLSQLEQTGKNLKVLTTNGTELKAGFYLFLVFCLSGLFLAMRIDDKAK